MKTASAFQKNSSDSGFRNGFRNQKIGCLTDFPGVRIIYVERFGIEYQIRDKSILIIDIYNCQTDPGVRWFKKV